MIEVIAIVVGLGLSALCLSIYAAGHRIQRHVDSLPASEPAAESAVAHD